MSHAHQLIHRRKFPVILRFIAHALSIVTKKSAKSTSYCDENLDEILISLNWLFGALFCCLLPDRFFIKALHLGEYYSLVDTGKLRQLFV